MKEEEYLEELMKDTTYNSTLNTSANLNAILLVLLQNKLTTEEKYLKLVEKSKVELQEITLKNLPKETKEGLEASKKFRDLFGKDLNDLFRRYK